MLLSRDEKPNFDYSTGFEDVKCELEESTGVLVVTLNRPKNLNAMTGLMVLSLMRAYWMVGIGVEWILRETAGGKRRRLSSGALSRRLTWTTVSKL